LFLYVVIFLMVADSPFAAIPIILFPYAWVVGVSGMDGTMTALLLLLVAMDDGSSKRMLFWTFLAVNARPEAPLAVAAIYAMRGMRVRPLFVILALSLGARAFVFGESLYAPVRVKMSNPGVFTDFWRYAFPMIPAALILTMREITANRVKMAVAFSIAGLLMFGTWNSWGLARDYAKSVESAHTRVIEEIHSDDTLAISDAGIIPFKSKAYTIDMLGLNTPAIANGTPAVDVVRWMQPTVVVLISADSARWMPILEYESAVYDYVESGPYERVSTYRFNASYWLYVYHRMRWDLEPNSTSDTVRYIWRKV